MTNKVEGLRPQDATQTKWYKSAKLPWGIIIVVIIITVSFIAGWHVHQAYSQNVEARASQLAEKVSKTNQ